MPVYHLDPWHDIVNVSWPSTVGYLVFDFAWGGTTAGAANLQDEGNSCSSPYSWPPPLLGGGTWTTLVRYSAPVIISPTLLQSYSETGELGGLVSTTIAGLPAAADVAVPDKTYFVYWGRRFTPSGSGTHPRAVWSTAALGGTWRTTTSFDAETAPQKIYELTECFYPDTGSSDPNLGVKILADDPAVTFGDVSSWDWSSTHPSDFSGVTATATINGVARTFVCTGSSYLSTNAPIVRLLLERQDLIP
jgi:hypothetical protein